MILQKIEIEQFGGLKDYTLTFSPGFQYIYGENETGKSTVCAFLSAMFYGMPAKVRGGGLRGDSRRLYMPWGEKYMAGTLYFSFNGEAYILKRRFGQTARGDVCALYHAADFSEISIEPAAIGPRFLGMGEEAFQKSLFISQLGAAFSKGKEDELMVRLSNLEQTGEEDASIQKALAELTRAEYELVTKTGRGGVLVQLDNETEALKEELATAKQKTLAFRGLLESIQQLEAQRDQNAEKLSALTKKRAEALIFEQFKARQTERKRRLELEDKQTVAQAKLEQVQKALCDLEPMQQALSGVETLATDVVLQLAKKEADCRMLAEEEKKQQLLTEEIEALRKAVHEGTGKAKRRVHLGMLVAAFAVFGLSLILGFLWMPIFYGITAVSLVLGVLAFLSGENRQTKKERTILAAQLAEKETMLAQTVAENAGKRRAALQNEINTVLQTAGAETIQALAEKIERARTLAHEAESLKKEEMRLTESIKEYKEAIDAMPNVPEETAVTYDGPNVETLDSELEAMRNRQLEQERHLAQLTAKAEEGFSASYGVSVIESELSSVLERKAALKEQYEAVCMAKTMMEACAEELKQGFAPALNTKSGELIARLTNGRYQEVRVTDDYTMMLKTPKGTEIIESDFLSAGTYDLVYFALRLSVLDILYEKIPLLIMDDTFLQLDKNRQQSAFCLLQESAVEQILYFSCHEPADTLQNGHCITL